VRTGSGLAILFVVVALGGPVGPALAGPRPEDVYFRYHAAIRAAVLCEGWKLEPKGFADPEWNRIAADRSRMDRVIHARVVGELPAGRRLQLMQAARAEADRVVRSQGCEAGRVQGWLWMFHTDLEPALVQ
jgi:hypothetical protein